MRAIYKPSIPAKISRLWKETRSQMRTDNVPACSRKKSERHMPARAINQSVQASSLAWSAKQECIEFRSIYGRRRARVTLSKWQKWHWPFLRQQLAVAKHFWPKLKGTCEVSGDCSLQQRTVNLCPSIRSSWSDRTPLFSVHICSTWYSHMNLI